MENLIKTSIFWIGSIGLLIGGTLACRYNKKALYLVFAAMIFSTVHDGLGMTFFPEPYYKLATRGFFIHVSYLFAIILFLAMKMRPSEYKIKWKIPLMIPSLLLILWGLISWSIVYPAILPKVVGLPFEAEGIRNYYTIKIYPLYELNKMILGLLVFVVTVNFAKDDKSYNVAIYSFAACLFYFLAFSLHQRYILGMYRITALDHTNNLNSFLGMCGLFIFPMAFYYPKNITSTIIWGAVGGCLLCIILTVSRSSLAAFVLLAFITSVVFIIRNFNPRNLAFLTLGSIMSVLFFTKAAKTLLDRFLTASTSGDWEDRTLLFKSAIMMANDHITGVGLGNFTAWQLFRYHELSGGEVGGIVHNIWFLTLAELGYIGLFIFIIYWLRYFQIAYQTSRMSYSKRKEPYFHLLFGAVMAIIFLHFQNLVHFPYRITSIYVISQIIMGITVAVYLRLKRERVEQFKLKKLGNV